MADLYDEIWIYGLRDFYEPLSGLNLPQSVLAKAVYTGYLRRNLPRNRPQAKPEELMDEPYILVTPGGGGDGEALVDWVLRAYETDSTLPDPALIVFGPFMAPDARDAFTDRIRKLPRVRAITFNPGFESLLAAAKGVVAMGGYNTFCEILSFDRPSLLVPRTVPRREQFIRAERAAKLGLAQLLADDGSHEPEAMSRAIHALGTQPRPSSVMIPGLLDGLDVIDDLATALLEQPAARIRTIG